SGITPRVTIHLEKKIPMAAGLGGGNGNTAQTLSGLNELFDHPLSRDQISEIAASLGSDVPFFLQDGPALGFGRGERIVNSPKFPCLSKKFFFLARPGFG